MILYHGSPNKIENLEIQTPRGNNDFNKQTGVYLTSNKIEAKLYCIARDKNKKNKGWAIKNRKLYLVQDFLLEENKEKDKLFHKLNKYGYLHYIETNNYEQSPYNKNEYIVKYFALLHILVIFISSLTTLIPVKENIKPYKIKKNYYDDIIDNIIYISLDELRELNN